MCSSDLVIADQLIPGARCEDLARTLCETGPMAGGGDAREIEQQIEKLTCTTGDTEIQLEDGRWVLHRDRTLPDGGKVGVRTDITALKKREKTLEDSAAHYRGLIDRSPVPIFVHRDGVVLYANAATAAILGYSSADDIVDKNILDLIHPDHHKLAVRRVAQAVEENVQLSQIDMKFLRFDGSTVQTEAQVGHVMYGGKPALESILHDISARRRTERALMESEQRYRNLFELSPDAILVHDHEHILFANETAAKMLGAANDTSLFGMPIVNIMSTSAPHPAGTHTCQLNRLDGETFDAEVVTATTNYHGQEVQQAVIRDITDRKRMDATMAQNAKLASLGSMAAGLAHELSQPLNIMRFAAEGGMLKMNKKTITDAQHARNYKLIQDQSERMAAVMDNMRIFSRKDPGPMQAFDMTLAVRNLSHLVRNPFRVDDVHIELLGPVSGIMAHGNAIQFEQVMLNVLNNARDSILERRASSGADESGRITIDCQVSPKWDNAVIIVTDNGGGIDAQDLGHIFDPFFTTKDEGHGTGLGLALSHEIITAMSGTMTARNDLNGACFTIRLPLIEATQPTVAEVSNDTPDATTEPALAELPELAQLVAPRTTAPTKKTLRHILVVEDEVEAARALADFLKDEGFQVSVAHNGREGLATYRAMHPDIVITDIRMPGMDGAELIRALRAERADLPIIAVTGHMPDTEELDSGPGLTPVKIMKKPVSLMALFREIGDIAAA